MSGYAIHLLRPNEPTMQYTAPPPTDSPATWDLSNLNIVDKAVLRAFCRALACQIDAEEQA